MNGGMAGEGFTVECRQGMETGAPESCVMVIAGASGDLTRRSLLPSVFELAHKGLLPEPFAVLGVSRSGWDDEGFRKRMRKALEEAGGFDPGCWEALSPRIHYLSCDLSSREDFEKLEKRVEEVRSRHGIPDNVFFHLATPPSLFGRIASGLAEAGMATGRNGWRRLVIEKPFGRDRASARDLHRELGEAFQEGQIYRVDHYLGKETVQNMLVVRFANPSFEPIWSNRYIDHVQITVAEDQGIGTRAGFYESTGVVRDMIQNHLLQLLCMAALEPPVRYDARSLRDETVKVLRAIRAPSPEECVLGQYGRGENGGAKSAAYQEEKGVAEGSRTPTFSALRLEVDNWRWSGVPFYLRTGKRMARKLTEVAVHFKPTPHLMFEPSGGEPAEQGLLVFRLQPEEGIVQRFVAKQPGPHVCLTPVTSRFLYADAFGIERPPRAYAWLILDVMEGEQTLFAREDWVDEAWAIVDPVVERAETAEEIPTYPAGSWGPPAADDLLARDGREWRRPGAPDTGGNGEG